VGGVSEGVGAKAGESNLSATKLLRVRDGERHPGFPEGGALRGASSERRPRSVRALLRGSSRCSHRTDDSGCPKEAEEGNVVRVRHKAHALEPRTIAGSRTRPSLGPSTRARRSSLHTTAQVTVVGRLIRHHGWANPRKWEEPTLGSGRRTKHGSPRLAALARESTGGAQEKEGDHGLRPCEDRRARVWLLARRCSCRSR